jgi:Coenzyme PQQ synthesis protein D (PqqD)
MTSRARAHRLNAVAAAVWRRCDGARTTVGITAILRDTGMPVTEEVVEHALGELARAGLRTEPLAKGKMTRRELMRRVGVSARLPLVTSIVVPRSTDARSCAPPNRDDVVDCEGSVVCCGQATCDSVPSGGGGQLTRCLPAGAGPAPPTSNALPVSPATWAFA